MNQINTKSKLRFFFISFLIALLFVQCDEDDSQNFPYVRFNITLSISNDLLNMNEGEYVFVDGFNYGLGGLIIYRKSNNEYLAFDRACTYEAKKGCVLEDDSELTGLLISCPCCGSKYWVTNNDDFGWVYNGPARKQLIQYRTYLSLNTLIVYNE